MGKSTSQKFWSWYERHYLLNISLSAGLFVLQLFHLYWLTTHVVLFRLLGHSFFSPSPVYEYILIAVDYTEIPALIATSILYIHELRRGFRSKTVLYLFMLNVQWLHLFWITDEFVINQFAGAPGTVLPLWLAWIAILIDYLELPVIVDTLRRVAESMQDTRVREVLGKVAKYYVWRRP